MRLQNTSLYICSNSKYVVHGPFKILQNYIKNKIIDFVLVSLACVSIDYDCMSTFALQVLIISFRGGGGGGGGVN